MAHELNFQGGLNKLSYGYVSFNILKELLKLDIGLTLWQIGNIEFDNKEDQLWLQNIINRQREPNLLSPTLKIWHQFALGDRMGRGPYFGYPIFELDKFDKKELAHLSVPDHLMVTSKWAKEVLENNGVKSPITVVPLGVNSEVINAYIKARFTLGHNFFDSRKKCTFINVGKWELRKGHAELIEAFNEAFDEKDDVELHMMPHNFFLKTEEVELWEYMYRSSKLGNKIKIHSRQTTHEDTLMIMNRADVGVFPSYAEGWGLPLNEMLALGKPCIFTPYSAHTEYIPPADKFNYHIELDGTEPAFDGKWFFGQGNWCKIKIQSLIDSMRAIYEEWKKDHKMINKTGIEVGNKFNWTNTAKLIQETIFC